MTEPTKNIPKKEEYNKLCKNYEVLGENLKQVLVTLLDDAQVDFLDVQHRIKKYESLSDKILRKEYKDPINEIEDICGLRVICYYPGDLEKIAEIIKREFNVINSITKENDLNVREFGYRSDHFVVTIKDDWLVLPIYKKLKDLKAEIQVRTILMHAWADVEHKLSYKRQEFVPDQLKRQLYGLSALFEIADERFEYIRGERDKYVEQLTPKYNEGFNVDVPLNLESLEAFLDFYFKEYEKSRRHSLFLLDLLINQKITLKKILEYYEKIKNRLSEITKELGPDYIWFQASVVQLILFIFSDEFWMTSRYSLGVEMRVKVSDLRRKIQSQNLLTTK